MSNMPLESQSADTIVAQPQEAELEKAIFYSFRDKSLLRLALTHESYAHEHECPAENNERLEFLGDSVLGCVVCLYLYQHFPQLHEGTMAKIKGHVASTQYLANRALELNLGQYLRLGRGEESNHGRLRINILADAMEAVIGAIYLDGGFEPAQRFVLSQLSQGMNAMEGAHCDYKSMLQEFTQHCLKYLPEYELLIVSGPPHDRRFEVEVHVGSHISGRGQGQRKKDASQEAAQQCFAYITQIFGFDLHLRQIIADDGVSKSVKVKENAAVSAANGNAGAGNQPNESSQSANDTGNNWCEFLPAFMLPAAPNGDNGAGTGLWMLN